MKRILVERNGETYYAYDKADACYGLLSCKHEGGSGCRCFGGKFGNEEFILCSESWPITKPVSLDKVRKEFKTVMSYESKS